MGYTQGLYPILSKTASAKEIYDITVLCPEIAREAQWGQFVHIKAEGFFLRRPISICEADPERGTIRLVYEVRGEGTKELSKLHEGDLIDIMGPLGKGFAPLDKNSRAIVIGGGIGTPPLMEGAKYYGKNATAIIGFRSANAVILEEDYRRTGAKTLLATDDGTRGTHGFVTDILKEELKADKPDIIYACGPKPMLKAVAQMAAGYGIRCQVSLEERMGCGIGACLVCACKTKRPDGSETYSHVCKDGPVFEAEEVVF